MGQDEFNLNVIDAEAGKVWTLSGREGTLSQGRGASLIRWWFYPSGLNMRAVLSDSVDDIIDNWDLVKNVFRHVPYTLSGGIPEFHAPTVNDFHVKEDNETVAIWRHGIEYIVEKVTRGYLVVPFSGIGSPLPVNFDSPEEALEFIVNAT